MLLTKSGGLIIGPISRLLGAILSLLYDGLSNIGIESIGIAIILFTILVRLLIFPMMYKQNKSSKITAVIQPEINKATKKYRGKTDQQSMMEVQRITKEIQEKYGVNLASGCLTSLIQFPIFIGLYRVIMNVPAYVVKVKELYNPIAMAISNDTKAFEKMKVVVESANDKNMDMLLASVNQSETNSIIDVLAKFPGDMWDKFCTELGNKGAVVDAITANSDQIEKIYNFFGIDLVSTPKFALTAAIIIPILSFIFQFLSMKVAPMQAGDDPAQQATMGMMRTMMYIFPVFSFFICMSVPSGVGLYWAAGSFISFLTTVCMNAYFKHCDMDKILEKSMAKAAKKIAKKKAKNKKSFMERMQEAAYGQQPEEQKKTSHDYGNLKSYSSTNGSGQQYRAGSLASKANIMQNYNDAEKK